MESLANSNALWSCLGFLLFFGVWFNDCVHLRRISWLCGLSVFLGLEVARYSEEINSFLQAKGYQKDLSYTIYAVLDVGIASCIINICRSTSKVYWAIPLVFFVSILTHFSYVTLNILYPLSEIFPIVVYLYIMIALNLFVIVYIGIFSDGFRACLQYVANFLSRCYNTVFSKLSHSFRGWGL